MKRRHPPIPHHTKKAVWGMKEKHAKQMAELRAEIDRATTAANAFSGRVDQLAHENQQLRLSLVDMVEMALANGDKRISRARELIAATRRS